jgi:MscS family membrane protein
LEEETLRNIAAKQYLQGKIYWLPVVFALLVVTSTAVGQERVHPLQPPDRSSPRATLKTFLDSVDGVAAFVAQEYRTSPTRAGFTHFRSLAGSAADCLDLSEVPPVAREKVGFAAACAIYETLNRIELPPFDEIPATNQLGPLAATDPPRWVIPNTEITLVRIKSGPRSGEFLFSSDTVARAGQFYQRVRGLSYTRPVPLRGLYEMGGMMGGWLVPFSWIEAMPAWLRTPLGAQSAWKWITLALVLAIFSIFLRLAYRLSLGGSSENPVLRALIRLVLPIYVLAATLVIWYLALVQIHMRDSVAHAIELAATAVLFLSCTWLSWRAAPVIAEAIIASPKIAPESIDAHLIRICTRFLALVVAVVLLSIAADRIGIPVFGIIAGLGVGGLAIALAAQPTIENLIGSLSLFVDKPIRIGNFCKYGNDIGTVEEIGLRSTRIRGVDRTLTTIPNAMLSKMPIVNFTQRDRMLINTVIGVRYETTPEQLRYILTKLREMLLGHPRIYPAPARVRFVGFGASSQDIEIFAYAMTADWPEFLAIREDVFLRIIDIVQQSGSGFAIPSQTLYFARDAGLNADRTQAAEAQVCQWRLENSLPFPNFSPEQVERIRGSLAYPPPGSPEAPKKSNPEHHTPEDTRTARSASGKGETNRK